MVFRGPMEIYDIAVFDGSSGAQWNKVSSYKRGGTTQNLYFMNNKNIDYSGKNLHGPQIFASANGKTGSTLPRTFLGTLAEAADPSKIGGGPSVDTGAEVNIMTQRKCSKTSCRGYHDTSYSYHGWGGGKKIFVTRVQMPRGKKPDQPAIWMLNAQTMYSGQYSGCNCRGVGAAGGCGELDIVEVIETNTARDRISTHYYFYDGSVQNPPGGDNFAPRPLNQPTVYITIIDDSGAGMVKILEVDSFNFDATVLSNAQVQQWARI
ncbi:hypothetical protein Poli38472_007383 [Pythium oligandrum]|uniref:Cell wall protein YJL171C/Tos1 C-terminal domain-containing protein n=1 Tax=Pythium oligandrum TaxID=41045 RepID=A0A8K1CA56_PYTOL|nr:hypothetical protein Poli38472_007383 [Pythium oligandrum]|eukprot:TMW59238.1 hypothetical protein Poli38472_007383 [Pythium oligandrum]